MRRIVLIFSFVFSFTFVHSQNRVENVSVGPAFLNLIDELDSCITSEGLNCIEIADKIIEKGKRERVDFMDYLYAKKAYYFLTRNEWDSVITYGRLALENPHPVEEERSDIWTYGHLVNAYYYKGDLDTAIDCCLKMAKILEDGGDPIELGRVYSNIAILLAQSNNTEKQIEYLQKSFKLLEENEDKGFIATAASNLGLAYLHKKDTINTKKWLETSLELAELSNDLVAKTQSNYILSTIEKDLNKSLQYSELSVKYADELKDKTSQSNAYYIHADNLYKLGKSDEAIYYAERAVNLAQEIGNKPSLLQAYKTAAGINYEFGKKVKAADYFNSYVILNDSISSAEKAREINEINTKYETEKKEKQLVEQELKIQQQRANLFYAILGGALFVVVFGGIFIYTRKAQKLKLKQLQQEKENAILNSFILGEERERKRISQELHDGVAAMIGAAKMSLESIPHLAQEKQQEQLSKVRRILENTHADVRYIAHNLLPTVLEKEGLIKATSHFAFEINETKLVNISVTDNNSNAQELSPQLQLMLFRVIQELVNNIIKHSQAQKAEIIFSNSPNGLQIEISDDGIGYDDTEGTGNQGLYSITKRLKSIGGNFKITKGKSGGTQAKVVVTV
ncbi:tetratricopeptide repeat protein [Mesonia sp. K7]|uniref:tetratricopeptide repeat-containing sensor histidine kinase n=1 Tax=Mesonia sp. K7 TaxID=2218606 RepID=UPI000DA9D486|nr:tetratricopeptide repeat protein [Mesonia sp. K7]PZD77109.1 hypothetical protein DNG35_09700 [Mesonia sp. K7]